MSAVKRTAANKFVWTRPLIIDLIEVYQNLPPLFCTTSADYKNCNKRIEAVEKIRSLLLEKNELAASQYISVKDIKQKIHNLRTQFFKELGQTSGAGTLELYKPKLSCYDQLKCLQEAQIVSESISDIPEEMAMQQADHDESERKVIFNDIIDQLQDSNMLLPAPASSGRSTPVTRKRNSYGKTELFELISTATKAISTRNTSSTSEGNDDLTVFGKPVATELSKIKDVHNIRNVKHKIFNMILDTQEEEEALLNNHYL